MKGLFSLVLAGLLVTVATFNQPAPAMKMNRSDQSVITDKYKQMKIADRIVIKNHSGTIKTIDSPSEVQTVVNFFEKRQFNWRQPLFVNNAPSGTYALEFYLVEDPLVTVGLEKRNLNFRDDGESFKCSLKDYEAEELTKLLGVNGF